MAIQCKTLMSFKYMVIEGKKYEISSPLTLSISLPSATVSLLFISLRLLLFFIAKNKKVTGRSVYNPYIIISPSSYVIIYAIQNFPPPPSTGFTIRQLQTLESMQQIRHHDGSGKSFSDIYKRQGQDNKYGKGLAICEVMWNIDVDKVFPFSKEIDMSDNLVMQIMQLGRLLLVHFVAVVWLCMQLSRLRCSFDVIACLFGLGFLEGGYTT